MRGMKQIEEDDPSLRDLYDHDLLSRLYEYIRPFALYVGVAVILLAIISVLELAGPYITKVAIDSYIATEQLDGLLSLCLIYAGVVGILGVVRYAQQLLVQWIGQMAMHNVRRRLFAHIQRLSFSHFDKTPVGKLMTRLTSDVEALNELFTSGVVAVLGDLFTLAGIMTIMFWMNWRLALLTFCIVPLLVGVSIAFRTRVRQSFRKVRKELSRLNSFLQEHITGMSTVQLFDQQDRAFDQFDKRNRKYLGAFLETIFYYAIFIPTVDVIQALGIGLILWYGGISAIAGTVTFGTLVAFIQYTERFWRPIRDLSEKYNILQSAMAAAERIFDLLDTEEFDGGAKQEFGRVLPVVFGDDRDVRGAEIVFDDVSFRYREDEPVLENVSFRIAPAESVALVGATGSGKTTIVRLLMRFYEVERGNGRILLDGTDIRDMELQALRDRIGVVFQDDFLFHGTVAENVSLWANEMDRERIRWALRTVGAEPLVDQLPEGINEELGERAANLSVGERQLLSFARCLAFDPDILVLDEATSSVDAETEALIQSATQRLVSGRTAVIVAHRLNTIRSVDRILALHHGKLMERGTHEELLEQRGVYYRLYRLQFKEAFEQGNVAQSTDVADPATVSPQTST